MASDDRAEGPRVVWDGGDMGYAWRAAIEEGRTAWRKRPRYRFVKEQRFMGWNRSGVSRWYRTRAQAFAAANAWLDTKQPTPRERLV